LRAYLITDPSYYGSEPDVFEKILTNVLKKHAVEYACFRDKESDDFEALAKRFVSTCKSMGVPNIFINSRMDIAKKLCADGVHLTAAQLGKIQEAKALGLKVVASTHSDEEIATAESGGADFITYSPIFETPNKGNPKGLEDLKDKVDRIRTNIIALGGIVTAEHVKEIEKSGAYAFASIRYFIENS
jgi:thiamine-phosphate pyrophosphorylase